MRTLLALVVLTLAVGAAHAEDRLDALAAAVDRAAGTPKGETAIVERMAAVLALTPERVRVSRVETRLGWGDLFIAHRLAARGGHSLEKVAAARRTNTAWTEIAEEARVDPAALADDVAAAWPDVARAAPAAAPEPARPAGAAEPARAPAAAPGPAAAKDPPSRVQRILDFFRGGPSDGTERAPEPPPSEEIRDRMLRGGGRR
jgi:hypothetical protein